MTSEVRMRRQTHMTGMIIIHDDIIVIEIVTWLDFN